MWMHIEPYQAAVDLLEIKEFVPRSSRSSKGTVQGAFPTRNKFSSIASLLIWRGLDSETCRSDFEIHTSLNEPKMIP